VALTPAPEPRSRISLAQFLPLPFSFFDSARFLFPLSRF
jgi:hypothetical protein